MTKASGGSDGSWSSWWFGLGVFLLARRDAGTVTGTGGIPWDPGGFV